MVMQSNQKKNNTKKCKNFMNNNLKSFIYLQKVSNINIDINMRKVTEIIKRANCEKMQNSYFSSKGCN